MNLALRPALAMLSRRILGAALAAILWAPVLAPLLMLAGNVSARLIGLPPFTTGSMLYVGFVGILIGRAFGSAPRPLLSAVDDIATDPAIAFREKLRGIWALPLGRFLMIYAALLLVLSGLSGLV